MSDLLSPFEISALTLSLKVGLFSAVCSLPFALLVALVLARGRFVGKAVLDAVVHLPLVLPPVVIGYLLLLGFSRGGPIGRLLESLFGVVLPFSLAGAVLAAAVMGFPLAVRSLRLALELTGTGQEDMARTLGRSRINAFITITLPLIAPGLLSGFILTFARSVGEFGATITFAANIPGVTQTLPLALYSAIHQPGGETAALRLAVLAVLVSLAALFGSEALARRMKKKLEA